MSGIEVENFAEKEIEDLHRVNNAFAEDTSIIHGDFHPRNVMVMDGELVLINMADITYGNPLYDLGSMILTHVTLSSEGKLDIIGFPTEKVDELWKIQTGVASDSSGY